MTEDNDGTDVTLPDMLNMYPTWFLATSADDDGNDIRTTRPLSDQGGSTTIKVFDDVGSCQAVCLYVK